jgi:amyloid beta precursor protein binding protein 1
MEGHPETPISDLRLVQPFPELAAHCEAVDLASLTDEQHMHVPFAIVLYHFVQQWRTLHGGEAPTSFADKKALRDILRDSIRMHPERPVPLDEENFEEAILAANTALIKPSVPDNVAQIIAAAKPLDESSSNFWIMVDALAIFVEKNGGLLPLRGSVPDMVSNSDAYIALQTIYVNQARQDQDAITATVKESLTRLGKDPSSISDFELKTFCKNAHFIDLVRTRSYEAERTETDCPMDPFGCPTFEGWEIECDTDKIWYVLLRAADVFRATHGHYPGEFSLEEDVANLKECTSNLLESWEWSKGQTIKDDHIQEMCRFGNAELHTVSSFLGGVAAQEVIKILTHQYVPINSFYLYNAMTGAAVTLAV